MFGMIGVIVSVQTLIDKLQYETETIALAESTMSPEQFNDWLSAWQAVKEKKHAEAIEERRHREVCEAIRSTGFWRLGA
jgi:hypothetical protein